MHVFPALTVLAVFVSGAFARFLTDREIENEVCTSSAYQIVSRATVDAPPTSPVDVIQVEGAQTEYSLDCLQVVESPTVDNPLLTAEQRKMCTDAIATMMWCQSDASLAEPQWSCSALVAYGKEPRTQTTYRAPTGKQLKFKVQWKTDTTSATCFPRDLTVIMVGHAVTVPGTQVGASVVFIIVVLVVGLLVLAFGFYMLYKVRQKFSKRDEAVIASTVGIGPYEAAVAAMGVSSPGGTSKGGARVVDFYGDGAGGGGDYGDGVAGHDEDVPIAVTVTDTNEVLVGQAMPKPWYKRTEYDGNVHAMGGTGHTPPGGQQHPEIINQTASAAGTTAGRRLQYGSQSPVDQAAPPAVASAGLRNRRGPSLSSMPVNPRMYDDDGKSYPAARMSRPAAPAGDVDSDFDGPQYSRGAAAPAAGYYNDIDADDDVVLTCTDCMLPIRDVDTPQYCAVTGKRHY